MRSRRGVLLLALALAAVGALLVYVFNGLPDDYGPVEYATMFVSTDGLPESIPDTVVLTTRICIGYALIWTASLLTAGVVGHKIATRRGAGR